MTKLSPRLAAARDQWRWRGDTRPPFAIAPGAGQTSVWDFPRPPRLSEDTREVVIRWGSREIARTTRAMLVLETAHPPSFYLPWDDVARELLQPAPGSSFCEWKGPARYWSLVDQARRIDGVAWSYPQPLDGAEALASRGGVLSRTTRLHGGRRAGVAAARRLLRRLDHAGARGPVQGRARNLRMVTAIHR